MRDLMGFLISLFCCTSLTGKNYILPFFSPLLLSKLVPNHLTLLENQEGNGFELTFLSNFRR